MSQFDDLFYDENDKNAPAIPNVIAREILINGIIEKDDGRFEEVFSPIRRKGQVGKDDKIKIGEYVYCNKETALKAVESAKLAYDKGVWPRMTPRERIEAVSNFAAGLKEKRKEIAEIIMWEICKNTAAAYKEVDRTVDYINDTIAELKSLENKMTQVVNNSGVVAQIKRSPLGVVLVAAPYNYPINETFTTLIPALIMGNTVVLKTPRTGGLCHMPLLALFRDCFPAGVVNILHGSGREVFSPIMSSGHVNVLAFIGSSKAAAALHTQHPRPFTVRLALGLDAKNPAFVLPSANLDVAVSECVKGALSFCGQRCTAIKLIFVHESIADTFVSRFSEAVDKLTFGLPWNGCDITPLAEESKPAYLEKLIEDCKAKGAKIVNKRGAADRSLVFPSVVYPVSLDALAAQEEQFGPLVPIVKYSSVSELEAYMKTTIFGQQAAIFSTDQAALPPLIDFLAHHVTRINLNSQCQRGPDIMPFSGRKCSAIGTLSVHDALRAMSIRVAVATSTKSDDITLIQDVMREGKSNILRADLLI